MDGLGWQLSILLAACGHTLLCTYSEDDGFLVRLGVVVGPGAHSRDQGDKCGFHAAFPAILESQCEAGISKQLMARHRDRMQQRGARFSSKTSQLLLNQLLGGASPTDVGAPTPAERAVKSGVLARPETLEFAQWLANNASHTATGFQEMCFNYSASSSNAVDSVASRIQGVVSETKGFIDMMMRYATPAAIERLEDQIAEFTESALEDVQSVIEKRVASLMGNSSDVIDAAIQR
ncbi:unnamed protein product, partial [Prorocentrum cordatum]